MNRSHLAPLDGLRGIAILMVAWFHIWQLSWLGSLAPPLIPWLNVQSIPETGYLGVELFFFLSGFCLFYPYARHMVEGMARPGNRHFAYRRFIKIVPSYVFALAVLAVAQRADFATPRDLLWQLGSHLAFVHPWFADTYESIDGVLWSLGVEVQFYVLFLPIAAVFMRSPFITFVALCGAAIVYRGAFSPYHGPYSSQLINNLPGVLDLFACGMLAAYVFVLLRRRLREHPNRIAPILATLGSVGGFVLLGAMLRWAQLAGYEQHTTVWQAQNRTLLGLDFIVIAVGSCLALPRWQAVVGNPLLAFLSVISYNLYIWHQLVARWLFDHHVPAPLTADPHNDPRWQLTFTLAAAAAGIAVASAITFAFERPLLNYRPTRREGNGAAAQRIVSG